MGEAGVLELQPIGRVVQGRALSKQASTDRAGQTADKRHQADWAEIEIDAGWAEALDGIDGFSHIWVVWWLDRFEGPPSSARVHPEGRPEMPLVGLFATRSPHRPCPIAMTAVRLLAHEGTVLRVEGLDACEGTPILDIKPYLRRGDLITEAKAPHWLEELWRIHDEERAA
jgi:tRNA-Thr(GGU) m(6)t(6)A37 methyltransferase TsaA